MANRNHFSAHFPSVCVCVCVCVCMLSRVRVLSHVCVLISVSRSTLLRIFCQDYRLVPQTAWTHLGVLTVIIKQLCLDLCAARACPAISLLFTVHSCLSKSLVCISTAQAREIWGPAAGACRDCALLVVPRAFSYMADHGGHFSWLAQGKLRFGGSKSTFPDRCKL